MNISAVDLNLFLVLHTVLEERSATRAAKRLHVTQSAVSNALARLRDLLADPLVVRSGRGLSPTPLALELAPRIATAIGELDTVLRRNRRLEPASTTRAFSVACTDNQELSDLPRLVELFHQRLPRATLHVVSIEQLVSDETSVDALIAPTNAIPPGRLHQEPLYVEEGVHVVRRDHPLVGARITREQFVAMPHIDVHFLGKSSFGHVLRKDQIVEHDLRKRIALTVPHFMAAAIAVTRTDYMASLPRRFAEAARELLPIRIVDQTFTPPLKFAVALFWQNRTHADEGARHFRELILEALRDPARKPSAARRRAS